MIRKMTEVESSFYKVPSSLIKTASEDRYCDFCITISAYLIIIENHVRRFNPKYKNAESFFYGTTISNNQITTQLLRIPNRVPEGITAKIRNSIAWLIKNKFLKCDNDFEKVKNSSYCEYDVTSNFVERNYSYVPIYYDELMDVYYYCKENKADIIRALGVLVFLRKLIPLRKSQNNAKKMGNGVQYYSDDRPEAYNFYYSKIADELRISTETVKKALTVLASVDILYVKELKVKATKDFFIRQQHIVSNFCARYFNTNTIIIGEEYYKNEINSKERKLKKYFDSILKCEIGDDFNG